MEHSLGESIKAWRESKGFTQADLAKKARVTEKTISNIENGRNKPQAANLRGIADALDVDLSKLENGYMPSYTHQPSLRFRESRFYPSSLESLDIAKLVQQHWGFEVHHVQPIHVEGDVDPAIRNSSRFHIRTKEGNWILREILRIPVAEPKRVKSKHTLQEWLNKRLFPTIPPTKPRKVLNPRKVPLELYEYIPGGHYYSATVAERRKQDLAQLIAKLIRLSDELLKYSPDLVSELTDRFGPQHQYENIEYSVKSCEVLRRQLQNREDYEEIERSIDAIEETLHNGLERRLKNIEDAQPIRLIHGDMTENNLYVTNDKLYLFDWDVCRLLPSGHFDLAFALVRLSLPNRHESSYTLSEAEKFLATELYKLVKDNSVPIDPPDDDSVAKGFDQVSFEFILRTIEYLHLLVESVDTPVDKAYIRRCSPIKVQHLKHYLFPKSE
jgi:transcriptional regulator with XRE-family HTH domain